MKKIKIFYNKLKALIRSSYEKSKPDLKEVGFRLLVLVFSPLIAINLIIAIFILVSNWSERIIKSTRKC